MSFWSDRKPRERVLIIAFAGVVFAAGGMKLLASEGEPITLDDGAPLVTPGTPTTPIDTGGEIDEEPMPHPKGAGSKRDPFDPLVQVGPDGGAPSGGAGSPAGSGGADSGDGDAGAVGTGVTMRLHDIYPGTHELVAVVQLDGTRFKGRVGQELAGLLTILELTDRCGVFEHGGDVFGLCVGQTVERER